MSAALSSRLKKLEAAAPSKPQRSIVCMPYRTDWHGHGVEVFAGVYRVEDRYRAGDMQIAYSDRAQLDTWLQLPEQADALTVVYTIVTPEILRSTLERLDTEF